MAKNVKRKSFEPEREIFAVYLGEEIGSRPLPSWLQELQDDGSFDQIITEFDLPPNARAEFAAILLAADLTMSTVHEKGLSMRQRDAAVTHVARLIDVLRDLESVAPPFLRLNSDETILPNGTAEITITPGDLPRARDALLDLQRAVAKFKPRRGRPDGVIKLAMVELNRVLDRLSPAMPRVRHQHLAKLLFDELRRRHGHKSRAELADPDDTPRVRDIFERLAQRDRSPARKKRSRKS